VTYIPTPGPLEGERYEPGNGTAAKERPILFSAPMVRALLAGTKTQTRRAVKGERASRGVESGWWLKPYGFLNDRQFAKAACPYGQPGDRLWVRESARCDYRGETPPENKGSIGVTYRAGGSHMQPYVLERRDDYPWFPRMSHNLDGSMRWAPGIHMPRWASRLLLEVTSVRVERLQAISEADALAEGIDDGWLVREKLPPPRAAAYRYLWEDLNGAGSWAANPWVWVVEFKRC
jgi:hypothetical protein